MKLLSIKADHFRGIRTARVDFASGLNILHGPNELGKSSLALAIRAALLLQSTAKESEAFVNWQGTGDPAVELVFESEPQRIWRVKKTFGTATASLEFSRNEVDFQLEVRGRQVDERLGEILQWGIAPPGGKGRPKGMPMTFLTTALLGEQERTGAIFEQGLSADSDESGRKQLTAALHAMAEDPLFKTVLARVQERVDEAFNVSDTKTTRKRGKSSPWVKSEDEIRSRQLRMQESEKELRETEAIEMQIRELLERRVELAETLQRAREAEAALAEDLAKQRKRDEIASRAAECKEELGAITRELDALAAAERLHAENARRIDTLTQAKDRAEAKSKDAAAAVRTAEEELSRLQSEDRLRERQMEQATLEKQHADVRAEILRHQSTLERIRAVEAAAGKVSGIERDLRTVSESVTKMERERKELAAQMAFLQWQAAREGLEAAENGVAQIEAWRLQASGHREAAARLKAALPAFVLPSAAQLESLRRLESDRRVAAARLDVGLSVTLRAKRPLRIALGRDGEPGALRDVDSTIEAAAQRVLKMHLEGIAELEVSGGATDAREALAALDLRWAAEAEPMLQQAGVTDIEALAALCADAVRRRGEIDAALREASQLEQRIADQPDWSRLLAERQKQYDAAEKAIAGLDRPKVRVRDVDALSTEERRVEGALSGEKARLTERQTSLATATAELDRARSAVEGGWQEALSRVVGLQDAAQKRLEEIEDRLQHLTSAVDENLAEAQQTADAARAAAELADAMLQQAATSLHDAMLKQAAEAGALQARRDAAAKLDLAGARASLENVETELASAPAPRGPVTPESIAQAQRQSAGAEANLDDLDREILKNRGALQQLGGDVARQKAEDAASELETARERAREREIEYEAWELLRKTLREVEQEQGTHLGNVLAGPVAKRFSELTSGRYGRLALGPNLETGGIAAAGDNRALETLSVGTRDQLSTIFRVTLAEYLETAVLLDDQLTQSDGHRLVWLLDLLKQVSSKIQVIVFTCRLEDYAAPGKSGKGKTPDDARVVDLRRFILK